MSLFAHRNGVFVDILVVLVFVCFVEYNDALTFRQTNAVRRSSQSTDNVEVLHLRDALLYSSNYGNSSANSSSSTPPTTGSNTTIDNSLPGTIPLANTVPVSTPLRNLTNQAVVAESSVCQDMGTEILLSGGNAIDAAITTLLCSGIVHPQDSGIGSGVTLNVYMRDTQKTVSIVGISEAPGAATRNMFDANNGVATSWLANAIPGFLSALREAHRQYGSLQWKALFKPVIQLARNGIVVDAYLSGAIAQYKDAILDDQGMSGVFVKDPISGNLFATGDLLLQPNLADTLEIIANDPGFTCEFYKGSIAQKLVNDNQQGGGIWTRKDLRQYRAFTKESISSKINNSTLLTTPLPSTDTTSGHFSSIAVSTWLTTMSDPQIIHQTEERAFFAYARLGELGDADFQPHIQAYVDELQSKWVADRSSAQVIPEQAYNDTHAYGVTTNQSSLTNNPITFTSKAGTAVSVIDCFGNAVAAVGGFGEAFGSKRLSVSTGILLNDDLYDFETDTTSIILPRERNEANYIQPYKRPILNTAPTIVLDADKDVQLIVSGSGSNRAFGGQASALIQTLLVGLDPKSAVDQKVIAPSLSAFGLEYELGYPTEYAVTLQGYGHKMFLYNGTVGSPQAIAVYKDAGYILAYAREKTWTPEFL